MSKCKKHSKVSKSAKRKKNIRKQRNRAQNNKSSKKRLYFNPPKKKKQKKIKYRKEKPKIINKNKFSFIKWIKLNSISFPKISNPFVKIKNNLSNNWIKKKEQRKLRKETKILEKKEKILEKENKKKEKISSKRKQTNKQNDYLFTINKEDLENRISIDEQKLQELKKLKKQIKLEKKQLKKINKLEKKMQKKSSFQWKYVVFASFFLFIFCFSQSILNKVNYTDFSNTKAIDESQLTTEKTTEDISKLEQVDEKDVQLEKVDPLKSIPDISNILLVGEENWFNEERGRTDSMMILTINKIDKTIKLTSLMRDSYVAIPNYSNNRLNAAYTLGGMPLLKETIETNYGITIDNSVLVNFDAFKKIIDILGGVDVKLTQPEIDFITSKKGNKDGTLKEGMNHLNGKQALLYARIRKVSESEGESNDFGRTSRQRRILTTLYNNYKEQGLTKILEIANEILPYITTDLTKSQIIDYITAVMFMKSDIETFRLPVDDGYKGVSIRKMSVLQLDWDKNRQELKEFIYGDYLKDTTESTNES